MWVQQDAFYNIIKRLNTVHYYNLDYTFTYGQNWSKITSRVWIFDSAVH